MLSDAFPPARSRQGRNQGKLLSALGVTGMLLCFALLNACSLGNSASMPQSTSPNNTRLTVSGSLPQAQVGVSYSQTLTVSGGPGPYTFSLSWGELPPGLTLNHTTGTISGNSTRIGTFNFGVHVTDSSNQGGASSFEMSVINPPTVTVTVSPSSKTILSAGTIQFSATVANDSNTAVTWSASSGTISSAGLYQAPAVSSSTTATITATSVAETASSGTASVTVTPNVVVTVTPATDSVASGGTLQYSAWLSNTSNATVTWSASSGSISSTGLYKAPTVSANTSVTVTAISSAEATSSGSASLTVTPPAAPPLTITTSSLPGATAGVSYSDTLGATGGTAPYSWTLSSGSMPVGVALQSGGSIAGNTSQSGQFNFTVQVADSGSPRQVVSQPLTLTVTVIKGGPAPAPAFMGFSESDTNGGGWPSQNYGMQRFWDSPPLQWPSINTSAGVFDFTSLDGDLLRAYNEGTFLGMYTLARTPPWASSNPKDSSCNYTTGMGGGLGECDAPYDLNTDGSGTNATWKAWISAIAAHVNAPGYTDTHAHIKYWEIWNEPDTQAFWNGSFAQLARLTEDANCIITGRGVIHENGNGVATACTATAIDPTAQIVMASAHAKGPALTYGQNELYCSNTSGISSYELPCPNPPNAIATAVDIVNFHMKPGNESGNNCPAPTPCTPESAMQMYVSNIQSILLPAEASKPLWDGEAQYSISGFSGAYLESDMAASFMPRFYLIDWTLGISGMAWYTATSQTEVASAGPSYQQTYDWLNAASLSTPCTANGTVWSCGITVSGKLYQIMWDTSQTCSSGTCTTGNQIVGQQWTDYQDMTAASTPIPISGNTVPVGIKPLVLSY